MTAEVVDMTEEAKIFAEEFIAYIRNTYMSGVFGNLVDGFEWNAYDRVEEGFLTNNPSEGANNRLFKRAKNPHPGVYKFCELLKSELEKINSRVKGCPEQNSIEGDVGARSTVFAKVSSYLGQNESCPEEQDWEGSQRWSSISPPR